MSVHLVFPDGILKEATKIASGLTLSSISQKIIELSGSNQWEKAIPYCLAAFAQNQSYDFLSTLAMCCHHAAMEQSKKLSITSDGEDYVNCAIASFSALIGAHNATYDTFAARGAMYLLKAQLDNEPQLLDKAEADCGKALALGSPNTTAIRENFVTIDHVRKHMRQP